jgi:UDP-N-acetyl-D-glucosamine dehydrogenase
VDSVAPTLRQGDLVIVQSTCPPGTTQDMVLARLARRSGLLPGTGFHLAYSPVRLNPGDARATLRKVPRVVAGATSACSRRAMEFLRRITDQVVPVSTTRTAEFVKIFEDTFRLVNISLVNELTALCRASHVDIREVLDAVATKPFGFARHHPGPGVGGAGLPASTAFFASAARRVGVPSAIVAAAVAVNDAAPAVVVRRLHRLLAAHRLPPLTGRRILVVGVTYKPDVPDVRESAAVRVLTRLRRVADVAYHDPYVPELRLADGTVLRSAPLDPDWPDLALLLTRHTAVEPAGLVEHGVPVVDCSTGTPALVTGAEAAPASSDTESCGARVRV